MKQSIGFNQFHDAFQDMGRGDNFSYEGLRVLFDWFEMLDDDSDTETELDVIAICCEYSEATPAEIEDNYNLDFDDQGDLMLYLNDNTMVCGETQDTIVYADF